MKLHLQLHSQSLQLLVSVARQTADSAQLCAHVAGSDSTAVALAQATQSLDVEVRGAVVPGALRAARYRGEK